MQNADFGNADFHRNFTDGNRCVRQNCKHGGAGTLVPITGFANAVSSPAIEFKSEGYVAGLGAKLFIIAGPVIVYGITASAVFGAVLWVLHMFGITLF